MGEIHLDSLPSIPAQETEKSRSITLYQIELIMKKLSTLWNEAFGRLFPTVRMQAIAWALAGSFVGLSAYLVYVSKAYSYLSDSPEVCINCHVMGPYYATWQHSSHAERAMQARLELARVLAKHGYTDAVPMPDVSTKEKAQRYIGLDPEALESNKDKFMNSVVPQWIETAKKQGRLVARS